MENKERAEIEQGLANMREMLPRMWWSLYQGSIAVGFSPPDAFRLVTAYILSQNPNGIRPSDGCGPESDS